MLTRSWAGNDHRHFTAASPRAANTSGDRRPAMLSDLATLANTCDGMMTLLEPVDSLARTAARDPSAWITPGAVLCSPVEANAHSAAASSQGAIVPWPSASTSAATRKSSGAG
eukprot:scaffold32388_cov31-Prasinocladus_malaysianus.AAC.2